MILLPSFAGGISTSNTGTGFSYELKLDVLDSSTGNSIASNSFIGTQKVESTTFITNIPVNVSNLNGNFKLRVSIRCNGSANNTTYSIVRVPMRITAY